MIITTKTRSMKRAVWGAALLVVFMAAVGCESFFNDVAGDPYKIAFVSDRSGVTNNIFIMNADGSEQTQLTFNTAPVTNSTPRWSPDGSMIVFRKDTDIYIMDADGSNQKNLTNDANNDSEPSWSPDGTRILFSSDRVAPTRLHIVNITSLVVSIPITGSNQMSSHWSVKTGKIVCQENTGNQEIIIMNPDGSNWFNVTNNPNTDARPSWMPDGGQILYSNNDSGNNNIYRINSNGSSRVQLTNMPSNELYPYMSADGELIAFHSNATGQNQIYIMDADGSNMKQLTFIGINQFPCWSPEL